MQRKTEANEGTDPRSNEKSRRFELLLLGHQKALENWEKLLTGSASREKILLAFRNIAQAHPEALEAAVRGDPGGFLLSLFQSELPTLQGLLPTVGSALCEKLVESIVEAVKSEVQDILKETNLHQKLLELEKLDAEYKAKENVDIDQVVPAAQSIQDDIRPFSMAAKKAYEERLLKELEKLESENSELEGKLHELNRRALIVSSNIDSQLQLLQGVGSDARDFLYSTRQSQFDKSMPDPQN